MPRFVETFPELKGYVPPVRKQRKRVMERHIAPRQDGKLWGIYNYRLDQWVGYDDYTESHMLFETPEKATTWYMDQL